MALTSYQRILISFLKIAAPLFLLDVFFRRLPYAKCTRPKTTGRCHPVVAELCCKPGDVLLCKGLCADSCVVSAWSLSEFSHIAIIGPDCKVYDITPIEHERCMSLPEFVAKYEGFVCWRPIKRAVKEGEWGSVEPVRFREALWPYMGALCSENFLRPVFENFQHTYTPTHMFCSEYVATALKLEAPRITHPMNFAPGGRFSHLFTDDLVALN